MTASPPDARKGSISKNQEPGKEMKVNTARIHHFFEKNVLLAPFTTMGIGGPARYFFQPASVEELRAAFDWADMEKTPVLILGGGSNLLLPDQGFQGLVIGMALKGFSFKDEGETILFEVMAGEDWDSVAAKAVHQNWSGLECLSGIPGKVGAAPIQNIGAYGQDVSETIVSVQVLDLETSCLASIPGVNCGFAYRHSIFKGSARGRYVIVSVTFRLQKNGAPTIRYPDLKDRLTADASLSQVRDAVLAVRREKSMVFHRDDFNSHGCGSFFTNPILDAGEYAAFVERAGIQHPHFPAEQGGVKLSAAWLIDHAGFKKGYGAGSVGLSQHHCLAIVNRGQGSAAQVLALAREIQHGVFERFGVKLVPEPVILAGDASV